MEFPNWFEGTEARQNFETFLAPYGGEPKLKFLQLGVYTGDASVWLMDNILTNKTSTLTDVDTWQGSDEEAHEQIDFNEVYRFYLSRMKPYKNSTAVKDTTLNYLRYCKKKFDFIYIDADHTAVGVLLDAELSWDLLKSGGIMGFDDYEWRSGKGGEHDPAQGINAFLYRHKGQFEVIHKAWQVWIRKA